MSLLPPITWRITSDHIWKVFRQGLDEDYFDINIINQKKQGLSIAKMIVADFLAMNDKEIEEADNCPQPH